jgi:hypothetical protein
MKRTVAFAKGNNVVFWQDMQPRRGLPAEVEFNITKRGAVYVLTASGYGQRGNSNVDGKSPYENGAIKLYKFDLTKEQIAWLDEASE